MDNEKQNKKTLRYNIGLGVSIAVLAACVAVEARVPSAWAILVLPALALAATALLWLCAVRFGFCRSALLMEKTFLRTVRTTLFVPVWLGLGAAFLSLPQYSFAALNENLAEALVLILVAAMLTIMPLALLTAGLAAVICGVQHWRATAKTQHPLYREGPFFVALAFFLGETAVCVWLFLTYL